MNKDYDITPFPYVGNNKYYTELSKDEIEKLRVPVSTEALPTSDEVEENTVNTMLHQVGLTAENEEPDVDEVLADAEEDEVKALDADDKEMTEMFLDDEFYLLKESLYDLDNGANVYFESAKFIENIKTKIKNVFKKSDKSDDENIAYNKVMAAAKAYTDMKFATARVKIALTQDPGMKNTAQYRKMQKTVINAERLYRKAKEGLNTEEIAALTSYNENFDSTFSKKIAMQIQDIKDAKKAAAIKKESTDIIEDDVLFTEGCRTEGCETECGDIDVVTEKNIDSDMKPIIDKLHSKGYKTKASSSGHKNVTTKSDGDKDNIRDDHHYGDARLVFDGKYDLGKAPKYWYWKKVDNADEVEYLDIMQIKNEEWPDNENKFENWKKGYMKSLTDWVDALPNVSDKKSEEVEEACCKESSESIDAEINTLYESVIGSLMFDILDI